MGDIPNFGPGFPLERMIAWVEKRLAALAAEPITPDEISNFTSATTSSDQDHNNRLLAGLLLADWACYERPADRVDFLRLRYVFNAFPTGFRLWTCQLSDGQHTPVGYTGWYPINGNVFETMRLRPNTIANRGFMKPVDTVEDDGAIYIFNYSIIKPLRRLLYSRTLLQALRDELFALSPPAMTAVAVSEDSVRVARRLGMEITGQMTHMGEVEHIMISSLRPHATQKQERN